MPKETVIVRSTNILKPPLLVTNEAMAVEFYDGNGEMVAVVHRVLDGNYWAFTSKNDKDWDEAIRQLGYLSTRPELDVAKKDGFFNG
jgi:hypothetical protein